VALLRVLLLEDHPVTADGLAHSLKPLHMEVVETLVKAEGLSQSYARCKPDVVLLDIGLGDATSGIDAARELLRAQPDAKIVFFSTYDDLSMVAAGYRVGALAYVTKITPVRVLGDAIRAAAAGDTYFLPGMAEKLAVRELRRGQVDPRRSLGERDLKVFVGLARGLTNEAIAGELGLSQKTISGIRQRVFAALKIGTVAEAAALAERHDLLKGKS
jgi:two-component system invasion response regulator UvrY